MKKPFLACTADIHIGNHAANGGEVIAGLNERARQGLDTFRRSLVMAREAGVASYFIAGDLFQTRRPEPALIAGVQRVLVEEAPNLPVIIVPGNHDMLDATAHEGNTACAPLYREATVIREPDWVMVPESTGTVVFCVPFDSRAPMSEYLPKLLAEQGGIQMAAGQRVLVCHVGVYDDDAPPWCRTARDGIHVDELFAAMEAGKFLQAFVGNFHHHKVWDHKGVAGAMQIVQVGTLAPHGFGDEGFFPSVGGMALYDGDEVTMVEVPGPRFVSSPATMMHTSGDNQDGNHYTTRAISEPKTVADKPDLPQAKDADSAFAEYVGALALPPGVTVDEVLAEVRATWKEAEGA